MASYDHEIAHNGEPLVGRASEARKEKYITTSRLRMVHSDRCAENHGKKEKRKKKTEIDKVHDLTS